jgi:hypothetical protein
VKQALGTLLSVARHVINIATILAAIAYFLTMWMHAPVPGVLRMAATMALVPLALAWVCGRIGRHLRTNVPLLPSSPVKKWLLAGAVLAVLVTGTTSYLTRMRQVECSMDPSRTAAARDAQVARDGFERVCEGDLERFDISFGSLDRAIRKLAFTPVDLAHTPFSTLESLGGSTEFIGDVPSRLYRGFRTPEGHRVTLSEHDMSADGSRSWRDPRDEPERINGLPARLIVKEDTSGAAISHLSWVEGRRFYELWIDANVVTLLLRERLFALAASLPRSVPGCPNEVPPKPFRIGPDGFPVDEPAPEVVTQAEMDVRFDQRKRPCK